MKKERIIVLFLSVFVVSCTNTDDLPEEEQNIDISITEEPEGRGEELKNDSIPSPVEQFLSQMEGKYSGSYSNTVFEMWIERTEQFMNKYIVSVLMFKKNRASDVQKFLTKYQDIQVYSNDLCEYIGQNFNEIDREDFYPEVIGFDGIWNDSDIGWGLVDVPFDLQAASPFSINTLFTVTLPINDEHIFESLHVDARGQAIKIELSDPSVYKFMPRWVRHVEMDIEKASSSKVGLLSQYYKNIVKIGEEFEKAQQNDSSYCDQSALKGP